MRNRQIVFTPKIEYELVAERSEVNQNSLTFPFWSPQKESNPHQLVKSQLLCQLSYGGRISYDSEVFS